MCVCGCAYAPSLSHSLSRSRVLFLSRSLLQYDAVCCSVLQWAFSAALFVSWSRSRSSILFLFPFHSFALLLTLSDVLQCVAVCCSVSQCLAVCCSVLQCLAVCRSVLQCVAVCCIFSLTWLDRIATKAVASLQWENVCCGVLRCVAVGECVLRRVAVCCSGRMCVAATKAVTFIHTSRYPDIHMGWLRLVGSIKL